MKCKFSNLEKLYWPKEKISKGDLIQYYRKMAKIILRYTKNRPLAMHRFPNGIHKEAFYQKDVQDTPSFVHTTTISHANRKVRYIVCQNADTLGFIANLGSIELHLFHSRQNHLDKPDYMILDLDPQSISFDAVVDTALCIHQLLQKWNVPHFCKTSGGSGLHIFIPLKAKYLYPEVRAAAMAIAQCVHNILPQLTSLERNPKKRKGKVYIDTLQNSKGQLVAAPYSVRGFPEAPVSTPLSWSEVRHGLHPKKFTLKTVPARVAKKGDLFKGVLGRGANIKKVMKKAALEIPAPQ